MEQAQEWVGAACHHSCLKAGDFEIIRTYSLVVDYPVPFNEERKSTILEQQYPDSSRLAVAWPGLFPGHLSTAEDYYMKNIEDVLQVEKMRPKVIARNIKKWENTLSFGKHFESFRGLNDIA
jgi:hypothetical protein